MAKGERRRGWLGWLLVVAFVVVPLVEIYLIIQVGHVIGAWWTVLLLLADALLGGWLVKHEGRKAWRALREALRSGRMPSTELTDAALILVAGTLMVTPGFLSDVVGFLLLLPLTRPFARRALAGVVRRRLLSEEEPRRSWVFGIDWDARVRTGPGRTHPGSEDPGADNVVRGEVVDEHDDPGSGPGSGTASPG